jgi:hypothetical protein
VFQPGHVLSEPGVDFRPNVRVDDFLELPARVGVSKDNVSQGGAVQLTGGMEDAWSEPIANGGGAARAGFHHIAGDDVRVDGRDAQRGEASEDVRLAGSDPACERYAEEFTHLANELERSGHGHSIINDPTAK